ncbi:hypothetical protein V3C99_009279 [Haemonchus contortus]|uniref:DUF5641 domain-containing protein n=1 Tax=Haemonchus placei TaxID=6290 RepID=A0A0N4VTW8_HAEPC|nr:Protein C46A5.8 [Haemonchus contortus]VDO06215.1 unnamed protein product [Haemonchus placei]
MLKWLTDVTSTRVVDEKEDGRDDIEDNDDVMMIDLILAEVEAKVAEFETEQELRKSQECLQKRIPDYSWLISDVSQKPKKYLTMTERSRLTRACQRIRANEWSKLINLWKARSKTVSSRDHIFDCFISSVHEVILSRPRPPTVGDVVRKYIRSASSVNAVSDSPRINGSTRSLAQISFRELSDVV